MSCVVNYKGEYFLKCEENSSPIEIINGIKLDSGMRKESFADNYVQRIMRGVLGGAINLGEKYQKYYLKEYDSFNDYLYKKELVDDDFLEYISLSKDESLWRLQPNNNNYSILDIIGDEDENLPIINQTIGEIEIHEI